MDHHCGRLKFAGAKLGQFGQEAVALCQRGEELMINHRRRGHSELASATQFGDCVFIRGKQAGGGATARSALCA